MHLILATEGGEFHSHKRFKVDETICFALFAARQVRRSFRVPRINFFSCKEQMNCVSRPAVRTVEKHMHAVTKGVDKTSPFHRRLRRIEVRSVDNQINVNRISSRAGIDFRHPSRHSVAADDGIKNARRFQRLRRPMQSLAHFLHG